MARILLIDDDVAVRNMARAMLERANHIVEAAGDGLAGIAKATDQEFDLVITDVHMPGLNGAETVARLRKLSRVPKILVMSGSGLNQARSEAESGADEAISKPFRASDLTAAVNRLLV